MRREMTRWVLGVLAISSLIVIPLASSSAADKVAYNHGWFFYGRDLYWFTALEKGFYAEAGLEVTLRRGFGSGDTAKNIASGAADFGDTDATSILSARAQDLPLRMVRATEETPPYVVVTLEGSGVNSLKDLEGRRFGLTPFDAIWVNFPIVAELNGIDLSKIKTVPVQPPVRDASLLAGQYEASTAFATQLPIIGGMAAKQGKKLKHFLLSKYGLDIYSMGTTVTDKTIRNRPDIVRRFLAATQKGLSYTIQHPDEGVDYLLKHNPEANREVNRLVWDVSLDLVLTPPAYQNGMGYMEEGKWRRTLDIISKTHKITKEISFRDLFTNEFLPKVLPPERAPRRFTGKLD